MEDGIDILEMEKVADFTMKMDSDDHSVGKVVDLVDLSEDDEYTINVDD